MWEDVSAFYTELLELSFIVDGKLIFLKTLKILLMIKDFLKI